MIINVSALRIGSCLLIGALVCAAVPAAAAGLQAGEYACAGSGGRILIGLGFKLNADGSYTDLDGKTSGQAEFSGSSVRFLGGHLNGYVGTNVRGGTNFEIHSISCSHN
jgi:hypothetical protein